MAEHTPGPWKAPRPTADGKRLFIGEGTGNWDVAEVVVAYAPTPEQAAANARLIASAPQLAASLGDFLAVWKGDPSPPRMVAAARVIMAQAMGEKGA